MQKEVQSPKGKLNRTDWRKIGIQGLMVCAGALGTWLIDASTAIDFGSYTPVAVTGLTIVANMLRKWGTGPGK
jgi:hypothetical protein